MVIEKEIIVNKNIEQAWKVLGTDFAKAHIWASPLTHSEGHGIKFKDSDCNERSCEIKGMGKTREKLVAFSNEKHHLSYEVPEGMPSVVKYATNSWTLTSTGQDQSKLHMRMDIQLGGIMGTLMQPMMRMMMSKMGNTLVEDFKYFLENGQPHPRKIKAMEKVINTPSVFALKWAKY